MKYRLGDLIELSDERNINDKYTEKDVKGISTQKMFIETKANLNGVSLASYKIVKPGYFAYVPDTSRRGDKISLAYNKTNKDIIVSSISVVFKVKSDKLLSEFLMMYFTRAEFDRYSRYNSWGSAREPFNYSDMCDIELNLPSVEIQQKYVDIYNSLLENQKAFENGTDDLKLVCDSYIENLRKKFGSVGIGQYIKEVSIRNSDKKINNVLGISKDGFISPNQKPGDIEKYSVFEKNNFVYSPPRINVGSIGLYKQEEKAVCSPIYVVFKINDEEKLIPDYLLMWLKRSEFLRSTDFYSIASVRNNFSYDLMQETKICIPSLEIQKDIVEIFNIYNKRKEIAEALKERIKNICPILIAGAIKEGEKANG